MLCGTWLPCGGRRLSETLARGGGDGRGAKLSAVVYALRGLDSSLPPGGGGEAAGRVADGRARGRSYVIRVTYKLRRGAPDRWRTIDRGSSRRFAAGGPRCRFEARGRVRGSCRAPWPLETIPCARGSARVQLAADLILAEEIGQLVSRDSLEVEIQGRRVRALVVWIIRYQSPQCAREKAFDTGVR